MPNESESLKSNEHLRWIIAIEINKNRINSQRDANDWNNWQKISVWRTFDDFAII